jgi:hypothetical protein
VFLLSTGLVRIRIASEINKTTDVGINATMRRLRETTFAVESSKRQILCECGSVALVIQHTMRMCRITLPCVTGMTVPNFTTRCHKRKEFLKGTEYKNVCFDFIHKVCLKLPYSKNKRTRYCRTCT